jgi:hypothetical protein
LRFPFPGPALVCAALVLAAPVQAQITPIGPFAGSLSETWESFPNYVDNGFNGLPRPTDIMGGAAAITSTASGEMVVYEPGVAGFGLAGSGTAQVSDGTKGLGVSDESTGTTTITFDNPVADFGAFWGAAAGAGFPDPAIVTLRFFDAGSALIGVETFTYSHSATGDGVLEFHGYRSTVGIASLSFVGTYVVMDGLRANPFAPAATGIPEPGTLALLLAGGMTMGTGAALRRHRP